MNNICIHLLNIGNFFPELTELTYPTIELFAKKIKAKINIITKRIFSDHNCLAEKLQVYEEGKSYDYNIFLDLDLLIHPLCYNPFQINIPPYTVAFKDSFDLNKQFLMGDIAENDGRNVGVSSCCVFTSRETHHLWKPIEDINIDEISKKIIPKRKNVDEYTLSYNLAKNNMKYVEPYPIEQYNLMFHVGVYEEDQEKCLDNAKLWCKVFWK
jgi:hypothetical protein